MAIELSAALEDTSIETVDHGGGDYKIRVSAALQASIAASAAAVATVQRKAQSSSAGATHPTAADVPGLTFSVDSTGTYLLEVDGKAIRNNSHATARFTMGPVLQTGTMTFVDGQGLAYDNIAGAMRAFLLPSSGTTVGFVPPASVVPVYPHLRQMLVVTALASGACTFKIVIQGVSGQSTSGDQIQLDNAVARLTKMSA